MIELINCKLILDKRFCNFYCNDCRLTSCLVNASCMELWTMLPNCWCCSCHVIARVLLWIESGISSRTFFSMTRNNAAVQPFSVFLNTFITGHFVFIHDLFADKLPNFLACLLILYYTNITLFMVKVPLTLIRVKDRPIL